MKFNKFIIFALLIICFFVPAIKLSSQELKRLPVQRYISYTLQSACLKYKKDYPFIKPVRYDELGGKLY